MNWNQLQYIVTTAQEKSITKAAGKLFISQPSLTLSIQNLEKELGVELFERSRGAMTLTYAGRLYYDWALNTLHSRNIPEHVKKQPAKTGLLFLLLPAYFSSNPSIVRSSN